MKMAWLVGIPRGWHRQVDGVASPPFHELQGAVTRRRCQPRDSAILESHQSAQVARVF